MICLWVGHRPCALEGGAGGGARHPLWFERGGGHLCGVGIRMGDGCSRGMWAFTWEVGICVGGGRLRSWLYFTLPHRFHMDSTWTP